MHQQIPLSSAPGRHCDVLFCFIRVQGQITSLVCTAADKSCSLCLRRSCSSIFIVLFYHICRCRSSKECLMVVFFFFYECLKNLVLLPLVAGWSNKLSPGSGVHPGGWDRPLPCLHAPLALRHEPEEVRALHIRGLRRQPQQFRLRGVLHGRVQAPE